MKRVLITGAAGRIGTVLRTRLRDEFRLRLSDIQSIQDLQTDEDFIRLDLADVDGLEAAMQGIDIVVHLGGIPDESEFAPILQTNIAGTYNVFEAARRACVQRMIFASSIHAFGFYPRNETIDSSVMPRPDTLYGVSKAFGENLARLYFDKHGVESVCIRICSFEERPQDLRHLSTWLSHDDAVQLFRCCILAESVGFSILYGVSDNERSWFVNPDAERLGYKPRDNAEAFAAEITNNHHPNATEDPLEELLMGGPFVTREYGHRHRP
ncbi:NAD-dependent epimerase/dehydratase family protein [Brevibacillus reuszeri]|uniref:NAD-dependent epimerase/dehydratase family protein n=1 Tax=Brevibacillus reuszeri TaxID=54915 RepID=UPI0028966B4C|nr:NAD(P)-dependent oxidoreductase [Brevibacillus reuszeri]